MVFEHGIEDDEEFPHGGDHGDFESLSFGAESLVEVSDGGVLGDGREASHVESGAYGSASALDAANAFGFSAIVVEGSQSDESSDLLAIEMSQFGHLGDESGSGESADAWCGIEQLGALFPVLIVVDGLENEFLDGIDFLLQEMDDLLAGASNDFDLGHGQAVGLGDTEFDELSSPGGELSQFLVFDRGISTFGELDIAGKAGNDACVEAVGLGEEAMTFGEVADLSRIDNEGEMAFGDQLGIERTFVATGSFHDEATGARGGKLLQELLEAFRRVGQREGWGIRKKVDIELVFGDVDSDEGGEHAGGDPSLRMRARRRASARAAVRVRRWKPATIPLPIGLGRPGSSRSVAGSGGRGGSATLRRLFHHCPP